MIIKEFPSIKNKLWEEYFCNRTYCLFTIGGANLETVKRYIESQGEK
ncbi:transposase [Clostridium perfringens]|nr:transposase [Clostridium perfringens]